MTQQQILPALLAQIALTGWTDRSLETARKNAALTPAQMRTLFPKGVADIVAAFQEMLDDQMNASIKSKRNFAAMRVRDKITFALRARLEAMEPYCEASRRLAVWYVMPRHIRAGAEHLWHSADLIWLAAGDTSEDYNRYTKRLLLIAVIKTTFAFWLNDESSARRETWEFLDRRIEDVMTLGKGIGIAKSVGMSGIMSFVRSRFAA